MRRKIKGGILVILGYILSPLSWWNDLFKKLFLPAMIIGYWITNIIGFILMHYGVKDVVSSEKRKYTKKQLFKDVLVAIIYTLIVIIFGAIGWIKCPFSS